MFGNKPARFDLYALYDATTHWTTAPGIARLVDELNGRYPGLDELAQLQVSYLFGLEARNNKHGLQVAQAILEELRQKGELEYACLKRHGDLAQRETAIVGEFRFTEDGIVAQRTIGFYAEGVKENKG